MAPIVGTSYRVVADSIPVFPDPGAFTYAGAVATKTGDQDLGPNPGNVVATWDAEVNDTNAFHSTVSNTSRITIPSAVNGFIGILHASIYNSHASNFGEHMTLSIQKNSSASWDGTAAHTSATPFGTQNMISIQSAPFRLVTGDIYELFIQPSSAVNNITKVYSTFGIVVVSQI